MFGAGILEGGADRPPLLPPSYPGSHLQARLQSLDCAVGRENNRQVVFGGVGHNWLEKHLGNQKTDPSGSPLVSRDHSKPSFFSS